ncbi:MAG: hypothetical protein AAB257_00740 [Nitrospinota bacterium]
MKGILNERITMKAKIFFIIFFTMIFNIAGASESQASESTDSSEGSKVAFGVYYNSSNNFQFDKIEYTYQNQKYTGSLFYDLSPGNHDRNEVFVLIICDPVVMSHIPAIP